MLSCDFRHFPDQHARNHKKSHPLIFQELTFFFVFSINCDNLSSSSEDSLATELSSSRATTCSREPSKKVSIKCSRAEWRARAGHGGDVHVPQFFFLMLDVALFFEHSQQGSHR